MYFIRFQICRFKRTLFLYKANNIFERILLNLCLPSYLFFSVGVFFCNVAVHFVRIPDAILPGPLA